MTNPSTGAPRPRPRRRKPRGQSMLVSIVMILLIILLVLLIVSLLADLFKPEEEPAGAVGPNTSAVSLPTQSSASSEPAALPELSNSSDTAGEEDAVPDPDNPFSESTSPDAWNMILVNRNYPLPDDFSNELTQPSWSTYRVDARIIDAMEALYDAAKEAGHNLVLVSGYRGVERQTVLYENSVAEYQAQGMSRTEAEEEAAKLILPPGTSEHHTGLAADIVCDVWFDRYAGYLDESYADYASAQWLAAHCAEYGFILRYPEDKTDITGVDYEPWHFRYVGVEAATEIMEQGICLEEYLGRIN